MLCLMGLFKMGAMGALAPAILKGLLAPAIFGQSITVSTSNSKVLNTHLPLSFIIHSLLLQ